MAKKLNLNIDYFEGYYILGIVSHLKDYFLTFHLNDKLQTDLKKANDFIYADKNDNLLELSCYYQDDSNISSKLFLISNNSKSLKLFPDRKEADYVLLFKDLFDQSHLATYINSIRSIPNILAVFSMDLNSLKDADIFIESLELHEIEINKLQKENFNDH